MSINSKLRKSFMLVILFFLVQSGVTFFYIANSKRLVDEAVDRSFEQSQFILQLALDGQKLRRYEKEYFIYINNVRKRDKYFKEWSEAKESIQRRMTRATQHEPGLWTEEDRVEFSLWQQSLDFYSNGFQSVHRRAEAGSLTDTMEANEAIAQAKNEFRIFLEGTDKLAKTKLAHAHQAAINIDTNFKIVYISISVISVLGIMLLFALLKLIPRSITSPVDVLTDAAAKMSKGDLNQKIEPSPVKEFKLLSETLERMRISQKTLIDRMMSKA